MAKNKDRKRSVCKRSHLERSSYWKVELQKSLNHYKLLYKIKADLPVRLAEEIVVWLQSSPFLAQRVFGNVYPRTTGEWKATLVVENASRDREVLWCCFRLRPYVADIAEFVAMAKDYERAFVRGNYKECLSLLDSVQEKFGLSLWLVKRRIHALQLARGLESQKEYASTIQNDNFVGL